MDSHARIASSCNPHTLTVFTAPDLQFQTESFLQRKRKQSEICASDTTSVNASEASRVSDSQIQRRAMTSVKKGVTQQQSDNNQVRKQRVASEMPQSEGANRTRKRRDPSPDWPSILPSSDSLECAENANKVDTSAPLEQGGRLAKRFTASESGQKSCTKSSGHDDVLPPHSRSASAPVMVKASSLKRTSQHSRTSPYLERQSSKTERLLEESHLSSQSPSLGDLSYDSILGKALAEASSPLVDVPVSSSSLDSVLYVYIRQGSDQESVGEHQGEVDAEWTYTRELQARDVEGYHSEHEQSQSHPDEFDQEMHDDTAEATYHNLTRGMPLLLDPFDANDQDSLFEDEIAGYETVNLIRRDSGGDKVLGAPEELGHLDDLQGFGRFTPSSDPSNRIDTLDVFGTDAEQARRVLFGTGFRR